MKILPVASVIVLTAGTWAAAYSGGNGTQADPWHIGSTADWEQLMDTPADWGKHFVLTADLDMTDIPMTPVGDLSVKFTGRFDGAGHTISNAVIGWLGADYLGLFGYVGPTGRVANLSLINADVRGRNAVGALAGLNAGTITSCRVTGYVSGNSHVGGLTGSNNRGTITTCSTAVAVGGDSHVGGLAGRNDYSSTIAACYATGDVNATGSYAGGLVGYDYYGSIDTCYATGRVSGGSEVGGLVGRVHYGTVVDSYATGAVNGGGSLGGLAGGSYFGSVWYCFWDMDASGRLYSAAGTGKTTPQMQTLSTFANAGWDFADTWAICGGTNYPRLRWAIPAADFRCPDGVDWLDLDYLLQRWLADDCAAAQDCQGADLTGDGRVDFADFAALAADWLK